MAFPDALTRRATKTDYIIAGSVVLVSWTICGYVVYHKLQKLKQEEKQDAAARQRAFTVVVEKIQRGDYANEADRDEAFRKAMGDYDFYIIAERFDN